jgi:hypothetical protein
MLSEGNTVDAILQRLRRPRWSRMSPCLLLFVLLQTMVLLMLLFLLFLSLLPCLRLDSSARRVHNSYQTGIRAMQPQLRLIWCVETQPIPQVRTLAFPSVHVIVVVSCSSMRKSCTVCFVLFVQRINRGGMSRHHLHLRRATCQSESESFELLAGQHYAAANVTTYEDIKGDFVSRHVPVLVFTSWT